MTDKRYHDLMYNDFLLTQAESEEGWHFCAEFDGLLVQGDPREPICGQACIDWMREEGD